ncbi:MAG: hypothetical protein KBD78_16035 [Oligoflexales bacterium]|nr:hypothetical protein [Oligoflexales bacterium]
MNKYFLGILIVSASISCATSKESTLLGVGIGSFIGGSLGATIGAQNGVATEGAFLGAATFGAIGGAIGYSEHKKKIAKNGRLGKNSPPQSPAMTMPQVRRVWVPDQIEDGKYIQGHFIYVIDKQSTWRLND